MVRRRPRRTRCSISTSARSTALRSTATDGSISSAWARGHRPSSFRRAAATGRYPGCSIDSPSIDHVSIAKGYGVEAERVDDPGALAAALERSFTTVASGHPYVVDVRIARRYGGAESTWVDFFSVARRLKRQCDLCPGRERGGTAKFNAVFVQDD